MFFQNVAVARPQDSHKSGDCALFTLKNTKRMQEGRNPKTGEKVKIKRKKLPFFKPGTELKERVDNK